MEKSAGELEVSVKIGLVYEIGMRLAGEKQFHDLFRWPKSPELRAILEKYAPRFEYALLDLIGLDLEELPGWAIMRLALGLLKAYTEGDKGEWFAWAMPLIVSADLISAHPDTQSALFRYMFKVAELKLEDFRAKLATSPLTREQTESIMKLADYLKQEGYEEGFKIGFEEGRKEGREKVVLIGQVAALQRALGQPVGELAALGAHSKEQLEMTVADLQRELSGCFRSR